MAFNNVSELKVLELLHSLYGMEWELPISEHCCVVVVTGI